MLFLVQKYFFIIFIILLTIIISFYTNITKKYYIFINYNNI